ncbi:MAG: 50S ribosomal protein L9 [Candidatus Neomarinimicrobiota bacterium]|jgi:large subunit ribosomal protein L9|nr:50S ribosomal protein L9 [Candidatus Neomarinimicrobiota bacterium]MDD3965934.1 50S ribosomal protein L9 [Candidatus Neomarinimicrobiota bacterium]
MKIILTKDVEKLGKTGDIVKVKDGYGRNYLIPKALGVPATAAAMKMSEQLKALESKKAKKAEGQAQSLAKKLKDISVTATMKAGEEDKLFGAVTAQIIADLLAEKGIEINKHDIVLDEPIKELGVYDVPVKVGAGVKAEIKVWVVKE